MKLGDYFFRISLLAGEYFSILPVVPLATCFIITADCFSIKMLRIIILTIKSLLTP